MYRPTIVAHADWGTDPRKQRLAVARLGSDGYLATPPEPAGEPSELLGRLAREGTLLLGFDFPIGLPRAYAATTGIDSFPDALRGFGDGDWREFWMPAERPEQITLHRPFYPSRPGGTRQRDLLAALGAASIDELRRRCEHRQPSRRAACALFWTLGGNQVGKAAINGWRGVLAPAVRAGEIALWPFAGPLDDLLAHRAVVIVETYPAEAYEHLGIRLRGSKRDPAVRSAATAALATWAERRRVRLDPTLRSELETGFASDDDFDAVVGLLGMLNVVLGHRAPGEPRDDDAVARVEGWILGQATGARPDLPSASPRPAPTRATQPPRRARRRRST